LDSVHHIDAKEAAMPDEPLDNLSEDLPEDRYEPSELEATLARQQGLGVGAKDLARQRDAHRLPDAADEEDDGLETGLGRATVPE
jgi:hypothetical protein